MLSTTPDDLLALRRACRRVQDAFDDVRRCLRDELAGLKVRLGDAVSLHDRIEPAQSSGDDEDGDDGDDGGHAEWSRQGDELEELARTLAWIDGEVSATGASAKDLAAKVRRTAAFVEAAARALETVRGLSRGRGDAGSGNWFVRREVERARSIAPSAHKQGGIARQGDAAELSARERHGYRDLNAISAKFPCFDLHSRDGVASVKTHLGADGAGAYLRDFLEMCGVGVEAPREERALAALTAAMRSQPNDFPPGLRAADSEALARRWVRAHTRLLVPTDHVPVVQEKLAEYLTLLRDDGVLELCPDWPNVAHWPREQMVWWVQSRVRSVGRTTDELRVVVDAGADVHRAMAEILGPPKEAPSEAPDG